MRLWLINLCCILIAVSSGISMFMLKYRVIEKEEELFRIHKQIAADKREIHMLKGDWALLNDPERLKVLVEKQTNLKAIGADQVIEVSALPEKSASDETGE